MSTTIENNRLSKLTDAKALRALGLAVRLPTSSPITKMGLDPKAVAELTPAAKKLTKADLEDLALGRITSRTDDLTVEDITSIKSAFGKGYSAGLDISCCCCTPCCCAVAMSA